MAKIYPITAEALRRFWPRAPQTVIDGTVKAWPAVAAHYGFNTVQRCAHFWGEISWECGEGLELRENLSYSANRILQVFGVGHHSAAVTADEAQHLARNPYALGERVYGLGNPHKAHELGNTQRGDGFNFRGGDALNSTGREAFRKIGQALGLDLESNPDLMNDPGVALWAGAEEYYTLGCIAMSDSGDVQRERKRINGGLNGLSGVEDLIAKWSTYFKSVQPVESSATETVSKPVSVPAQQNPAPAPKTQPAPKPQSAKIPKPPPLGPHPADAGAVVAGAGTTVWLSHQFQTYPPWAAVAAVVVALVVGWVIYSALRHRQPAPATVPPVKSVPPVISVVPAPMSPAFRIPPA